jgi:beta-lactamase regulating signal transducer with metallopeptidase domain
MEKLFGMEALGGWLLKSTLQATVLISVILLVKALVGKRLSVRWHHALWMLLVVRMIFPWGLAGELGIFNLVPMQAKQSAVAFARLDLSSFSLSIPDDELKLKQIDLGRINSTQTALASQDFKPQVERSWKMSGITAVLRIADLLLTVWLLVVALLSVLVLRANIKLFSALKHDKKLSSAKAITLFEQCKNDLGIKTSVHVIETGQVTTPALFGFLSPRLLLPLGFAQSLSPGALRHIFLHELAHIKRRDALVGWVMNILQILHWFNPIVWLAFRGMRSDRELATDGLALSILNQDEPKQYGQTIIQMLELFSKPGRLPAMTGVLEQNSQVKRRIEMISEFKKNSYKWSPWAIAILAVVGCMSLPEADLESKDAVQSEAKGSLAASGQDAKGDVALEQTSCISADLSERLKSCEFLNEPRENQELGTKACGKDYIKSTWDKATNLHLEAVGNETKPGTKDKNTIEKVLQMYDELEKCSNLEKPVQGFDENTRPTHYRIAYYRAELLFIMEEWSKCGKAFDEVTKIDPKGMYTTDAAYGALLCYSKAFNPQGKPSAEREMKFEESKAPFIPKDLDEAKKVMLASYNRYVCLVPQGEDTVDVKYRRARIYYEANMFAESAVLFDDLVKNHPESELAVYAANLYLDSLNALAGMVEHPNPNCIDDLKKSVESFLNTDESPGKHLMEDEEFAAQLKRLKIALEKK